MSANHRLWHMKSDKCATKSVRLLLRCSCEGDIQCSQMSHDYRSHTIFAMLSVRTTDARAELITRIATASLSECQQRGIGWPGGEVVFLCAWSDDMSPQTCGRQWIACKWNIHQRWLIYREEDFCRGTLKRSHSHASLSPLYPQAFQ